MASANSLILGIDQGTTSTRACLMDRRGRFVALSGMAHRQFHPQAGWVEHDPGEIWRNTRSLILSLLRKKPKHARIAGIGIANPGETVALWDRESGRPLERAIVWQDTRTQAEMDLLSSDAKLASLLHQKTGLRADPYFSASKIQWLLRRHPENRSALCAGTIDSWLIWNLTKGRKFITDPSTAARTLLYDIQALRYDPELLALFQVPAQVLPEVGKSAGLLGEVRGFGKSLDGTPILASLVDQPAALLGLGRLEEGQVKATYGTGCFIYMNTGNEPRISRNGLLGTIAWDRGTGAKPVYALDGGIFAAGSVFEWLKDQVGLIKNTEKIESILRSNSHSEGLICVPALAGLAAPIWERSARAAWLGLSLHSTGPQMVRAAAEGVAARVAQVIQAMRKDCDTAIPSLLVDGGLTRSPAFMQIQADLLGIPVEVSANPDATVFGACALAARQAGLWDSDQEILRRVKISRKFHPKLPEGERIRHLERFSKAARLIGEFAK